MTVNKDCVYLNKKNKCWSKKGKPTCLSCEDYRTDDRIKRLNLELYEECNSDTLNKFMEEHRNKTISPLRFIKLLRYLAKPDCYGHLNKTYKDLVDKFREILS